MSVPWYLMAKGKGGDGYKTASGPIVSVNDALAAPLRSLVANIEPVQEGTGDPSPDNVRPISGWNAVNVWRTGKNLLSNAVNSTTAAGVTFTVNSDRSITIATDGVATARANLFYSGELHLPPSNYYLSIGKAFDTGQCYFELQIYRAATGTNQYINTNSLSGFAFTLNDGDYIRQIYFSVFSGKTVNDTIYPQIELGSTATAYEPYSGNQYTIQLGQTVYGGTLDVTNGVLTVDRAMVDLGTMNWGISGPSRFYNTSLIQNFKRATTSAERATGLVCSAYKPSSNLSFSDAQDDFSWLRAPISNVFDLMIKDTHYTTTAEFKAAMSGVQLVYELATPIEIPLTPTEISTLQGQNNVWADSGDVAIEYLSSGGANADLMKLAVAFMGKR